MAGLAISNSARTTTKVHQSSRSPRPTTKRMRPPPLARAPCTQRRLHTSTRCCSLARAQTQTQLARQAARGHGSIAGFIALCPRGCVPDKSATSIPVPRAFLPRPPGRTDSHRHTPLHGTRARAPQGRPSARRRSHMWRRFTYPSTTPRASPLSHALPYAARPALT